MPRKPDVPIKMTINEELRWAYENKEKFIQRDKNGNPEGVNEAALNDKKYCPTDGCKSWVLYAYTNPTDFMKRIHSIGDEYEEEMQDIVKEEKKRIKDLRVVLRAHRNAVG